MPNRLGPLIRNLTVLCTFLMVAVGALIIALVAQHRAASVADCINSNLGHRSGPTARDAAAHIAFARAVDGLFLPKDATPAERAAEALKFKAQVQMYVTTLVQDQAVRIAHPLGRC